MLYHLYINHSHFTGVKDLLGQPITMLRDGVLQSGYRLRGTTKKKQPKLPTFLQVPGRDCNTIPSRAASTRTLLVVPSTQTNTYSCIYLHICIRSQRQKYTHIYIYKCAFICMYMWVYVCIYVCKYVRGCMWVRDSMYVCVQF